MTSDLSKCNEQLCFPLLPTFLIHIIFSLHFFSASINRYQNSCLMLLLDTIRNFFLLLIFSSNYSISTGNRLWSFSFAYQAINGANSKLFIICFLNLIIVLLWSNNLQKIMKSFFLLISNHINVFFLTKNLKSRNKAKIIFAILLFSFQLLVALYTLRVKLIVISIMLINRKKS